MPLAGLRPCSRRPSVTLPCSLGQCGKCHQQPDLGHAVLSGRSHSAQTLGFGKRRRYSSSHPKPSSPGCIGAFVKSPPALLILGGNTGPSFLLGTRGRRDGCRPLSVLCRGGSHRGSVQLGCRDRRLAEPLSGLRRLTPEGTPPSALQQAPHKNGIATRSMLLRSGLFPSRHPFPLKVYQIAPVERQCSLSYVGHEKGQTTLWRLSCCVARPPWLVRL